MGGTAVKPGSYPFVVTVGDTTAFYCGGTLIAPNVVLTAAHCLTERRTALAQLRVSDATRTLGVARSCSTRSSTKRPCTTTPRC